MIYAFDAELWLYAAETGSWTFLTVPPDVSEGLRTLRGPARGWGSMRIAATIGETRWRTSIFPDKRSGGFLLPVKAEVRRAEAVAAGDRVRVTLEVEV